MKRCFTKKVSKWLIHWKYPQPHCFSGTHKLKTVMWFHYTLNRKAKIDRIEWGPECRTSRTFRQCRKECSWVAAQLCFLWKLQNRVQLFATPWTAASQASLSITNSWSPPKPISIESVMSSNHLILCHPLLLLPSIFPSIRVFLNESALCIRWQRIGASASASVLPMNIQDWFPLRLTG